LTDYMDAIILGIHITGAAVWVGGVVALGVVSFGLRGPPLEDPIKYSQALPRVARRLTWVMWPALLITVLTGLYNLDWYLPVGVSELSTPQGTVLLEKASLVVFVIVVSGLHTFYVSPSIRRRTASGRDTESLRPLRQCHGILGMFALFGSIGILFLAALLAWV
jgi:copper resistance protein D